MGIACDFRLVNNGRFSRRIRMATPAPTMYCQECGALVKTSDRQCWMCSRTLRVTGSAVTTSSPPQFRYEAEAAARWVIVLVALGAMVPAAMVGFFVTCSAAIVLRPYERYPDNEDMNAYMISGCAGALIACVAIGVLIFFLQRRTVRKIPV